MSKTKKPREHWTEEPDEHDYPAAAAYLGLLFPTSAAATLVENLRKAEISRGKAKDLLRASRLDLLPDDDPEVRKDVNKVAHDVRLSPVLLVRGSGAAGVPLIVADGYHRICASYHLNEDESIPYRLVDAL